MESRDRQDESACSGCGGPHPFDTSVPSAVWNRVIRGAALPDFLCLTCIVRAFVRAGEGFTAELSGDGFHGVPIEVVVAGRVSTALAEVSSENTRLRRSLQEAIGGLRESLDVACRPVTVDVHGITAGRAMRDDAAGWSPLRRRVRGGTVKPTRYGSVWWDFDHGPKGMRLGVEAERSPTHPHYLCFIPYEGQDASWAIKIADDIIGGLRAAGLADQDTQRVTSRRSGRTVTHRVRVSGNHRPGDH